MRVYIPSYSRHEKCHISVNTFTTMGYDVTLCVLASQRGDYAAWAGNNCRVSFMVIPDELVGVGPMKQYVLDHALETNFIMADDDIRGFSYKSDTKEFGGLVPATPYKVRNAIAKIEQWLQTKHAEPAIASIIDRWVIARPHTQFYRDYGFARQVLFMNQLVKEHARFDRVPLMVDIDFCLQALKAGVRMLIPTYICHESPGMARYKVQGGCGEARQRLARGRSMKEVNRSITRKLHRLHKDVIQLNPNPNARDAFRRISWYKAYQIGMEKARIRV